MTVKPPSFISGFTKAARDPARSADIVQSAPVAHPAPPEKHRVTLGIIALNDCAPIVVAREKGFFAKHGLDVRIRRESSWAAIRDKVACGLLDGAQMLAPMPLAATVGDQHGRAPMVTAFSLGLNGNAITVSNALYQRMAQASPEALTERPITANALRAVVEQNRAANRTPLRFGVVFPTSTHHYELRYWLASAGIDPDRDVRLEVIPPPSMVEQLRTGRIDGYCVGEPWNTQAIQQRVGQALISKYELWHNSPEKVLGVTEAWVNRHPRTHLALICALLEACAWLDEPANRTVAARLLAKPPYVGVPEGVIRMSLCGEFAYQADSPSVSTPDFNVFHRYQANFPWRSHAAWFLTQMIRWRQVPADLNIRTTAQAVYRPDIYREACDQLGLAYPDVDDKAEGHNTELWTMPSARGALTMGPDRFFDGRTFDPEEPRTYLRGFQIGACGEPTDDSSAPQYA